MCTTDHQTLCTFKHHFTRAGTWEVPATLAKEAGAGVVTLINAPAPASTFSGVLHMDARTALHSGPAVFLAAMSVDASLPLYGNGDCCARHASFTFAAALPVLRTPLVGEASESQLPHST